MSLVSDIKEWVHIRANNQRIAMLAGMENQFAKLPENDPRTAIIRARMEKLRESIDWGSDPKDKEVSDGSDSQ